MIECRLGKPKILSQDRFRGVLEPIREEEGGVLRKTAIVEDKQELAAFFMGLNGMGDAGREIPEITRADVVDKVAPLLIDRRDPRASAKHVLPFGFFMPVHLA